MLANRLRPQLRQAARTFMYKRLEDVKAEGMVKTPSDVCESRRYLTRKDGMGFSFHETVLYKGKKFYMHYLNHLEAVFISKGTGWIELVDRNDDLGRGKRFKVEPGVMYALDNHDSHWLGCDADEDLHCLCVFTPPCDGPEVLSPEGVFPFIGADGKPRYDYWKKKEQAGERVTIQLKETTPQ